MKGLKSGALLAVSVAMAISGCASFPNQYDDLPSTHQLGADMEESWSSVPAFQSTPGETGFSIQEVFDIPEHVGKTDLTYSLTSDATLRDLIFGLESIGLSASASDESLDQLLKVRSFKGDIYKLSQMIGVTHNLVMEYRSGVLVFNDKPRYTVTVPQNKDLVERLVTQMGGIGATDVQGDVDTGVITYIADPRTNEFISQYLQRAARNAAMVKLQVAVIDVRLNKDQANGFDWSELSLRTLTGDEPAVALFNTGVGQLGLVGNLSGSGASWLVTGKNFSLSGALRALSRYGTARTDQDIVLSTLSGSSVKIYSGTSIPYVDNIGTVSNDRNSLQSVQTASFQSGLTVDVLPYFDIDAGMVTTQIEVDLSSLVAFRELNAGDGLGTISQPEIQETNFANITRLSPGETAILGGISYDQVDENYTSLSGLEKRRAGSKSVSTSRHALFIMIRPTVVTFSGRRLDAPVLQMIDPGLAGSQVEITSND